MHGPKSQKGAGKNKDVLTFLKKEYKPVTNQLLSNCFIVALPLWLAGNHFKSKDKNLIFFQQHLNF